MQGPSKLEETRVDDAAGNRRSFVLSIGLLAVLVAVAWWCDAWLWMRLRVIAEESHTAHPTVPILMIDAKEELESYPPRRLANFLTSSSKQIRTVVSLALADPRPQSKPEDWDGVFLKLFAGFRRGKDYIEYGVVDAMRNVPTLTKVDADAVFEYAVELIQQPGHQPTTLGELLTKIGGGDANAKPTAVVLLFRSMETCDSRYRTTLMERLVRLAPDSKEAREAVRRIVRETRFIHMNQSPGLELLRREPELIDELIAGDQKLRMFAVMFTAQEIQGQGGPFAKENLNPKWLTPERFDRIAKHAKEIAPNGDRKEHAEYWAPFSVLMRTKDGSEWLFDLARRSSGLLRREALSSAASGARRRPPAELDEFFETRLKEWLEFLDDADANVRRSAFENLFYPERDEGWRKRHSNGVDSPIIVAVRKYIAKQQFQDESAWLRLFVDASPTIDPRDLDLIAGAVERFLKRLQIAFKQAPPKQPFQLPGEYNEMITRLQKHSTHPAARRLLDLRTKLEADGVVEKKKDQPSAAKTNK